MFSQQESVCQVHTEFPLANVFCINAIEPFKLGIKHGTVEAIYQITEQGAIKAQTELSFKFQVSKSLDFDFLLIQDFAYWAQ